MSSHHIVREGQEPALIIANGAACQMELLSQLLEWSPYVLVLDGALPRVLSFGIKIDAVLGDFDSERHAAELLAHQPETRIVHTPDQEMCDLEKGIVFLAKEGHTAANIVWATGLRADHTLNNINLLGKMKNTLNMVMLDDYSRIFPLMPEFTKWYPANTPISLMPVTEVSGLHTTGLQWNAENLTLVPGHRSGSSNRAVADGLVTINHRAGDLLLMECWD